ncbi:phosphatase PAP2 family protein [Actinomadura sp. WMMB 499]|uniref:bifunctional phosphatase PAP2/O-acyltransferase family protein n=1 Tax=Actinomadura sp. WMMB 499 TaxID=1219491 RepID=UPI00159EB277|nr:phosphatase PAP2 family protein [Actinomadura sp. WMMB 499]
MRRHGRGAARGHARGRFRAASAGREIAVGLLVFGVYAVFTKAFAADRAAADANGRLLLDLERRTGLDVERSLNEALARHEWLGVLAAWEYATTYVVGTFGFLGYLWWRRSPAYPWARNTLIWMTLIAIVCFALWPVTPPRLLPGGGYLDIIAVHHPPATWGTGVVSAGANPYAAMPSLHIGWIAWIGAAAVRARCGPAVLWACVLHLAVTSAVIVATAAHYVIDIPAGLLLVPSAAAVEAVRVRLLRRRGRAGRRGRTREPGTSGRGQRVAAPDAFFLYVEDGGVPQVVGGVAEFAGPGPSVERVRALMAERLPRLPRLTQRVAPAGRLRRPRWVPAADIDLDRHVIEVDAPAGRGRGPLDEVVARLAATPLDRDRPLWRFCLVRGGPGGRDAAVIVMHHAIADGIGVVDILRGILEPRLPEADVPRGPGLLVRAAAVVPGLVALARDGAAPAVAFAGPLGPRRRHTTATLPLDRVRATARDAGVRVTDLLLALVGEVVAGVLAGRGEPAGGRSLRAAVPVTLRAPAPPGRGRTAVPGNLTAALRLDVPVDRRPLRDRLAVVHRSAERRRASGRAVASTAVLRLLGALPPPLHARAARAVYRDRFFGAIVSNMPGPDVPMSLAGAPLGDVHPILPLADGVPLAVGALSWNGSLHVAVTAEPRLLPEADGFAAGLARAFDELSAGSGDEAEAGSRRTPT